MHGVGAYAPTPCFLFWVVIGSVDFVRPPSKYVSYSFGRPALSTPPISHPKPEVDGSVDCVGGFLEIRVVFLRRPALSSSPILHPRSGAPLSTPPSSHPKAEMVVWGQMGWLT